MGFLNKNRYQYDCQLLSNNSITERTVNYFHGCPANWNIPLKCALLSVEVRKTHMLVIRLM